MTPWELRYDSLDGLSVGDAVGAQFFVPGTTITNYWPLMVIVLWPILTPILIVVLLCAVWGALSTRRTRRELARRPSGHAQKDRPVG